MGEIYKITCIPTNMCYIGQAVSYLHNGKKRGTLRRWRDHINEANSSITGCVYLNNAITKYTESNFKIEIIHKTDKEEELNSLEEKYIEKYNSLAPNGYNLTKGGKGCRASDVTKKKQSSKKNIVKKEVIIWSNDNDDIKYESIQEASKKTGLQAGSIRRSCECGYIAGKIDNVKYHARYSNKPKTSRKKSPHPNRKLSNENAKNVYFFYYLGIMNKAQLTKFYNISYNVVNGIINERYYQ